LTCACSVAICASVLAACCFTDACFRWDAAAACASVRFWFGAPLALAAAARVCFAVCAAFACCCFSPASCFSSTAIFALSALIWASSAALRSARAPGVSGWFARYFRCASWAACCWWASGFAPPLLPPPPLPPEVNWPPVADPGAAWFGLNRAAAVIRAS